MSEAKFRPQASCLICYICVKEEIVYIWFITLNNIKQTINIWCASIPNAKELYLKIFIYMVFQILHGHPNTNMSGTETATICAVFGKQFIFHTWDIDRVKSAGWRPRYHCVHKFNVINQVLISLFRFSLKPRGECSQHVATTNYFAMQCPFYSDTVRHCKQLDN